MSHFRPVLGPRLAGLLGLVFFVFLLLVIVAADIGRMPHLIRTLHSFPQGDRVGHVVLFGILAFLLASACPRPVQLGRLRLPAISLAVLLFAVAEELSQRLFSTRTVDAIDLVCSIVGVIVGTVAAARGTALRPVAAPLRRR